MARNATKAQVAARFAEAKIVQPKVKLSREELQARMNQRSTRFASAKGKAARSRANTRRSAIACSY